MLNMTDWLSVASSIGAKYSIWVADHWSGFMLWNTSAHNFSMAHTAAKRDLLAEYALGSHMIGVQPGVFISSHVSEYLGVSNGRAGAFPRLYGGPALTQAEYDAMLLNMVSELLAYDPFVWWWDVDMSLALGFPPHALDKLWRARAHQTLCLVGTTRAHRISGWAPRPTRRRPIGRHMARVRGSCAAKQRGDPLGEVYMRVAMLPPARCMVLAAYEQQLKTVDMLVAVYLNTVGRSCNLMLYCARAGWQHLRCPEAAVCRVRLCDPHSLRDPCMGERSSGVRGAKRHMGAATACVGLAWRQCVAPPSGGVVGRTTGQ